MRERLYIKFYMAVPYYYIYNLQTSAGSRCPQKPPQGPPRDCRPPFWEPVVSIIWIHYQTRKDTPCNLLQ